MFFNPLSQTVFSRAHRTSDRAGTESTPAESTATDTAQDSASMQGHRSQMMNWFNWSR